MTDVFSPSKNPVELSMLATQSQEQARTLNAKVSAGHCPFGDSGGISELEEDMPSQTSIQKSILKISKSSAFSFSFIPRSFTPRQSPLLKGAFELYEYHTHTPLMVLPWSSSILENCLPSSPSTTWLQAPSAQGPPPLQASSSL